MSMQSLVKKKFVLYYRPEFIGGEKVQLVEGMEFTEGGFRPPEVRDITDMKVDDVLNIGGLKILRVN